MMVYTTYICDIVILDGKVFVEVIIDNERVDLIGPFNSYSEAEHYLEKL